MEAVTPCADGLYMTDPNYPIESITVSTTDPNGDYNISEDTWQQNHLVLCLTDGMKRNQIKPTNYHN